MALNKIIYSTYLLIAFNLSTPSNSSSTLLIMLFQNLPKPPSQHFSREHLRHVNIFFHVLVYSCQPIVASVGFKVPQAVVRSPGLGANQPSCPKSGPTDLTVQTIGSAPSKQQRSSPEAFRAGHCKDLTEPGNRARKVSGTQGRSTLRLQANHARQTKQMRATSLILMT